jgi:predicted aldo/keto reductase-like oxidoreductase
MNVTRKSFLKAMSAGVAAGAASPALGAARPETRKKKGMVFRKLGRTGLWISEIGHGGSPAPSASVFGFLTKKGVNWFDTSSSYEGGKSEKTFGKYLKKVKRKDFVVVTKMHAEGSTKKEDILEEVDGSLKRLGVKVIDVLLLHGLAKMKQLENPAIIEAFEELKKAGKIRATGISIHKNMMELLPVVIKKNYHDVLLVGFNVFSDVKDKYDDALKKAGLSALLEKAHAQSMGILAMKVQAGGDNQKLDRFLSPKTTEAQAKIMWALSHPFVAGVTTEAKNTDEAEEDVGAVGRKLSYMDRQELYRRCVPDSPETCRMCGLCAPYCPRGIEIADIQRFLRYYNRYHGAKRRQAVLQYRALPADKSAGACDRCGKCEPACPFGVKITRNLEWARKRLA